LPLCFELTDLTVGHVEVGMRASNVGEDKDSEKRQKAAIERFAKANVYVIVESFSGGLHDTTMMSSDRRIGEFLAMDFQRLQRADLVHAHQAAIADHVGREDRSQPTLDGWFVGYAAWPP
jgi:hypothetical protein